MQFRKILCIILVCSCCLTASSAYAETVDPSPTEDPSTTIEPSPTLVVSPTDNPAPTPVMTLDEAFLLLRSATGDTGTGYAARLDEWSAVPQGTGSVSVDPETPESDTYDYPASDKVRSVKEGESVSYRFSVEADGLYEFWIDYLAIDRNLTDNTVDIQVDEASPFDEATGLNLPGLFKDETKTFSKDRYGNEMVPRSIIVRRWQTRPISLDTDPTSAALRFHLTAGEHTVHIFNRANPLVFGHLVVQGAMDAPAYSEYRAASDAPLFDGMQTLRAIDYSEKNSSYINEIAVPNPDLEPFVSGMNSLNAIDEIGFKYPGQELSFNFDAPQTAFYRLSFVYASSKEDDPVYRSILVDGRIPFAEFAALPFEATSGSFRTKELADSKGTPYEVLLEKGPHTLTLRVVTGTASTDERALTLALTHISSFTQQIRRITGKEVDVNRTWKITTYLPDAGRYLDAYLLLFRDSLARLSSRSPKGVRSAGLANLAQAIKKTERLALAPDELPLHLDLLQEGTGSIAELLGLENMMLLNQPMSLNAIHLHGEDPVPDTRKSFLVHVMEGIRSFIDSFSQTSSAGSSQKGEDHLTVWVNRSIQQVDLTQKLTDSRFTELTGIQVDISQLTNEGRLVLAKASGSSPDVVLGLSGWLPYELSIRGAGYDLSQFPDFWNFASNFSPGAFSPLMIDGKVYAVPESMDFQALFYRKDILGSLGLSVPDTWDDVIDMLPELQRAGLGFYHQMAVNSSYKYFMNSYVDIAQFGCKLYSEDGTRLNLTSPEGVAALDFQTRLFTTYSMPEQVASFYQSFRRGTIPIGVGNFTTYVQLKSAAPEIAGRWGIALLPGQKDAEGVVQRWTPGMSSTAFLFADTALPDDAWTFMKWWLSSDTQSEFAYLLQSTFGPTYMWLPANLAAVDQMPVEAADREVIREQLNWIAEPVKTPATYIVERGLSDVWNSVVFNGVPVRVAIDRMQITADRELRRKLEEFGYIVDGTVVKPYKLPTVQEIQAEMANHAND